MIDLPTITESIGNASFEFQQFTRYLVGFPTRHLYLHFTYRHESALMLKMEGYLLAFLMAFCVSFASRCVYIFFFILWLHCLVLETVFIDIHREGRGLGRLRGDRVKGGLRERGSEWREGARLEGLYVDDMGRL